ncbi:site-specific integrase [Methylobacterium sp. 10]|uniref:tyrosine-type recombinase/integrase n=1 Tax=Methylobacterium sp. 10 TaxID=1101191 RepID=UPI000482EC20|nr:site-specific integrase [Methylobacterium sp. 10]
MAREVNKLTVRTVQTVPGPGRFGDGAGLYLVVDPTGARRWIMIYRFGGKQREMGLGSATVVSLADARRRRDEARRLLADGIDPLDTRRKASAKTAAPVTFGAFADELIPELCKGFRNAKHAAQWSSTLKTYAPALRAKPVAAIETNDIIAVLSPIWTTKPETASRVRGRIERVLDAAKAKNLRSGENPARWRSHLDQLLPKRQRLTRGHHAALPYADVPGFVSELRTREAVSALALEFLILTAGRVSEITGCRWSEIDRGAKVWTVPAERMKAGRIHRVPLSARARAILDTVEPLRRGEFVFPSFRADRPFSNAAFDALMTRMGVSTTPHGFRSSFRDWTGEETTFPREVAEAALAHSVGDATELAYRRGDALEKRRVLMDAWADFVSSRAMVEA